MSRLCIKTLCPDYVLKLYIFFSSTENVQIVSGKFFLKNIIFQLSSGWYKKCLSIILIVSTYFTKRIIYLLKKNVGLRVLSHKQMRMSNRSKNSTIRDNLMCKYVKIITVIGNITKYGGKFFFNTIIIIKFIA